MDEGARELVRFAGEHRFVLRSQALQGPGMQGEDVDRLLADLVTDGLVRRERALPGAPAMVRVTQEGLDAVGGELSAPGVAVVGVRREIAAVWLWLAARSGAFGQPTAVWSRRRLMALDTAAAGGGPVVDGVASGPFGVRAEPSTGQGFVVFPDVMVPLVTGHRVTVHVELRDRPGRDLEAELGAWAAAGIDAMVFLTDETRVGERVVDAAGRAGVEGVVHVQPLAGITA